MSSPSSLDIYGCHATQESKASAVTIVECYYGLRFCHRHLSNIDCLMACTACLVCFISTVNGRSKKRENALEDVALVAGTKQNLSNLYYLDIYGFCQQQRYWKYDFRLCASRTSKRGSSRPKSGRSGWRNKFSRRRAFRECSAASSRPSCVRCLGTSSSSMPTSSPGFGAIKLFSLSLTLQQNKHIVLAVA